MCSSLKEKFKFKTIMCTSCTQPCSAQLPELKALTAACALADGQETTIFTDNAYAHAVCQIYGSQWKRRGFKKSDGCPIEHLQQIQLLLAAMMRPKRLAICKCKAHKRGRDYVTLGNAQADFVAKEAALNARAIAQTGHPIRCPARCVWTDDDCRWCSASSPEHFHYPDPISCSHCQRAECPTCGDKPCEPRDPLTVQAPAIVRPTAKALSDGSWGDVTTLRLEPTFADVKLMQHDVSTWEENEWVRKGAKKDHEGLWRNHEGLLVAPVKLINMLIWDAHDPDHCAKGEVKKQICDKGFWAPRLQDQIAFVLRNCDTCAKHNRRRGEGPRTLGHVPLPEGPFTHLVMDYIDMTKTVNKFRYVLVVICRYSRWVEACPSPSPDEKTVIKFIARELIPRFGIPTHISSDNGSHFTASTWQKVAQVLRIRTRFGCVYHPQSQGMVERANGTPKNKIAKICASSGLNWVDALPIALWKMRSEVNRSTHLMPHEILTGRPMPAPRMKDAARGPSLESFKKELKAYVRQLSAIHKEIYHCQEQRDSRLRRVAHENTIQPGDYVYLRVFKRSCLDPRAEDHIKSPPPHQLQ